MVAGLTPRLMMVVLVSIALPAAAELLPDPTRPAIEGIVEGGADSTGAASNAGLQSVIISPRRRAAVINGVTVEQSGKIGDDTLIEVRKSSVVLRNAQGMRVVELFPGVALNKPLAKIDRQGMQKEMNISEPTSRETGKKDERRNE
jgi:hypothetical protein